MPAMRLCDAAAGWLRLLAPGPLVLAGSCCHCSCHCHCTWLRPPPAMGSSSPRTGGGERSGGGSGARQRKGKSGGRGDAAREPLTLDMDVVKRLESLQARQNHSGGGGSGSGGGSGGGGDKATFQRVQAAEDGASAGELLPGSPRTGLGAWGLGQRPFWCYLLAEMGGSEIRAGGGRRAQQRARAQMHNTLAVPWRLEKLLMWGTLLCLDSFLFIFTFLPLRFGAAAPRLVLRATPWLRARCRPLRGSECVDIARMAIIVSVSAALSCLDVARAYHNIRGQAMIKLYVIYNILEICDKMCCYIGPDLLDALFRGLNSMQAGATLPMEVIVDFFLSLLYVFGHSCVLLYQVVTLQVAMNSSNNALLTLLVSNNFVELKGSVFKKFERDNLFQIAAADMSERFHLILVLLVMLFQQLARASAGDNITDIWAALRHVLAGDTNTDELLSALPTVMAVLWLAEMLVDWIKHAFIVKFNHIAAYIYTDIKAMMCADVITAQKTYPYLDRPHASTQRLGFSTLPRAALAIRMLSPLLLYSDLWVSGDDRDNGSRIAIAALIFACLLALKVSVSIHILGHAYRKVAVSGATQPVPSDSESDLPTTPDVGPVGATSMLPSAPSKSPTQTANPRSSPKLGSRESPRTSGKHGSELSLLQHLPELSLASSKAE
jgi:hypothetical protein